MGYTPQTPMGSDTNAGGVTFDHGTLRQLAYHVRWSAALAADGRVEDSAPHAIIAGALLGTTCTVTP